MDENAARASNHRLLELEDTLFQAQFYLQQAMQCRADDNRNAILRITHETLQKAINSTAGRPYVDL